MKQKKTNLKKVVHMYKDMNDMLKQMSDDAEIVGRQIEELLKAFDLRIPYACSVMMMMLSNILAAVTVRMEQDSQHTENVIMELYQFHLGEYRRLHKEGKLY